MATGLSQKSCKFCKSCQKVLHRAVQRVASTERGARLLARVAHHLDRWALRLSGERASLTSALAGLPIVWLTTTGAKTGQPRRSPLVGLVDGDRVVVIASNFGQTHYPAWYHNLRAHPQAQVTLNGQTRTYTAREATGAEREGYWQQALAVYPGYAAYAQRVGNRHIPVMVLTPVEGEETIVDKTVHC